LVRSFIPGGYFKPKKRQFLLFATLDFARAIGLDTLDFRTAES
jgi:hypothetical protein